jgi:hypothetical protein
MLVARQSKGRIEPLCDRHLQDLDAVPGREQRLSADRRVFISRQLDCGFCVIQGDQDSPCGLVGDDDVVPIPSNGDVIGEQDRPSWRSAYSVGVGLPPVGHLWEAGIPPLARRKHRREDARTERALMLSITRTGATTAGRRLLRRGRSRLSHWLRVGTARLVHDARPSARSSLVRTAPSRCSGRWRVLDLTEPAVLDADAHRLVPPARGAGGIPRRCQGRPLRGFGRRVRRRTSALSRRDPAQRTVLLLGGRPWPVTHVDWIRHSQSSTFIH